MEEVKTHTEMDTNNINTIIGISIHNTKCNTS